MHPYSQTNISSNTFQRVFEHCTDSAELVWHRDRKNRTVRIIEGRGWKFQLDNSIPKTLKPGDTFDIPANTFHRIIKGSTNLKIEIVEHEIENKK